MAALLIRPSREDDIAAITRIYAHHVLHGLASFEEVPPEAAELAARRANVVAQGLPHLVGERDGAVVGYSYAGLFHARSAYRFTIEDSVYIDAGHVGRGIGRALLSRLIALCEQGPWRQIIAVIGNSGNRASVALHEAEGFRLIGIEASVGFKFGRWLDVVLMQRALGEGATTQPEPPHGLRLDN